MFKLSKNLFINKKSPPLIIAEISGNHGGNKKLFLKHIESACLNGADLIKIQTYEPVDIVNEKIGKKFYIKNGIWKNKNLYNLYKKACTPFKWHSEAFKLAKKYKKTLFSSPFSLRAVDLLESLNCKLYKIASFEITDIRLLKYIASKKKPIIISTGMASFKEIKRAINIIEKYHSKIIIMHCVSNYPTKLKDTNLSNIIKLKSLFKKYIIGLSDHTKDNLSSLASIPLGIKIIEKHFKINNKIKTADSNFSITPNQLKNLKSQSSDIFFSLNSSKIKKYKTNKFLRRSIYAKKNIKKDEYITKNNIEILRPKLGICASKYYNTIGAKTKKRIEKGEPIYQRDLL
jgi:pseudaminic acid synthase